MRESGWTLPVTFSFRFTLLTKFHGVILCVLLSWYSSFSLNIEEQQYFWGALIYTLSFTVSVSTERLHSVVIVQPVDFVVSRVEQEAVALSTR